LTLPQRRENWEKRIFLQGVLIDEEEKKKTKLRIRKIKKRGRGQGLAWKGFHQRGQKGKR